MTIYTAKRFAVHANTIRYWLSEFNFSPDAPLFTGAAPFNKLSEAAAWLVHEIRALCPQPEFGTRQIAARIVRAGVKLSRSTVQRILRKPKPPKPPPPEKAEQEQESEPVIPHHILRPLHPNRTWHLDLATIEFCWLRFYVAALLDGYSRKLLALRVYRDTPTTANMLALVRTTTREFGAPRFLVTDHGVQFRSLMATGGYMNALRRSLVLVFATLLQSALPLTHGSAEFWHHTGYGLPARSSDVVQLRKSGSTLSHSSPSDEAPP